MEQLRLPIWEEVKKYHTESRVWLHVPGHGGGPGLPPAAVSAFSQMARYDLTELPGLDDLFCASGAIAEAQALAAAVWHAKRAYFMVNGSSAGILAMILATCDPEDIIIAPRNAHASFYHAIILSGANPVYLPVTQCGALPLNVSADAVTTAFATHTKAKALFLTSPTYLGICPNLIKIEEVVRKHHALLLVDEAHGAHLGFFPSLPSSAVASDLRVQSWHKTLGALTPGAVLFQAGSRIDEFRLQATLQWAQTSSPSYPVLLSLDAVRHHMAQQGCEVAQAMFESAQEIRHQLHGKIPLLDEQMAGAAGCCLDQTKITLLTREMGANGITAAVLLSQQGIDIEYAQGGYLLAVVSPGFKKKDTQRVVEAMMRLPQYADNAPDLSPPFPEVVMNPRRAFYAKSEFISPNDAMNRVSAGMVVTYPPGVPLLAPGELITGEIVEYLVSACAAGMHFRGLDEKGRIRVCVSEVQL